MLSDKCNLPAVSGQAQYPNILVIQRDVGVYQNSALHCGKNKLAHAYSYNRRNLFSTSRHPYTGMSWKDEKHTKMGVSGVFVELFGEKFELL